ncbi:MAG: hypothetical protein JST68_31585 [Bacteroidetes bacterium]|nr:hypothetical protein [Bacteroidota bacterium]
MKACLLRTLLLGLALAPCFTNAQNEIIPASYSYNRPASGAGGDVTCNVPLNEISVHAFRRFHKQFPSGTSSEYWFKSEDGYQVSFIRDDLRHQAFFDTRGGFLYSLKYYAGDRLSKGLADLVHKKYSDFRIDVVTEITDGDKTFYLAKIISDYSVKTLSLCDGKMELLEELVNGGAAATITKK